MSGVIAGVFVLAVLSYLYGRRVQRQRDADVFRASQERIRRYHSLVPVSSTTDANGERVMTSAEFEELMNRPSFYDQDASEGRSW